MPTDHEQPDRDNRIGGGPGALLACAVLVVCSASIAVLAWTRPITVSSGLAYTQSGRLSYSAPVNPSSVYGAKTLTTGQPIYTRFVNSIRILYSYRFLSSSPALLAGTEQARRKHQ